MAVELYLERRGTELKPVDEVSATQMMDLKRGKVYRCELKQPRNYEFHKKLFALFNFAFENWEQPEGVNNHGAIRKSFDRFRKDLTILAGYYEQDFRVNGDIRVEAKSLNFASMPQEEFDQLYSDVCDVVIKNVLHNYTKEDLERVVLEAMRFAA